MYSAIVCIVHTVHHMLIPKVDNFKRIPFCIVLTDISVVFFSMKIVFGTLLYKLIKKKTSC